MHKAWYSTCYSCVHACGDVRTHVDAMAPCVHQVVVDQAEREVVQMGACPTVREEGQDVHVMHRVDVHHARHVVLDSREPLHGVLVRHLRHTLHVDM